MKTLFAALASATILAAPLAASAQPQAGDHHGGWNGQAGAQHQAPPQANPGGPGRGGRPPGFNPGGPNRGAPAQGVNPGGPRNFGGNAGRPNGGGYAQRGYDRGFDRGWRDGRAYDGRAYDGRAYAERGFRPEYRYRAYDPRFARDFRWAVGAYLPRYYWTAAVDPYAYGLGAAPWGYHWVVVDGEALLIQDGTGAIVQAFLL